jgi:hypothetical protein
MTAITRLNFPNKYGGAGNLPPRDRLAVARGPFFKVYNVKPALDPRHL